MIGRIINLMEVAYDFSLTMLGVKAYPNDLRNCNEDITRQYSWGMIEADSGNALINHIKAFGAYDRSTDKVIVTDKSMYAAFTKDLHLSESDAQTLTTASMALPKLSNLNGVYFCPFFGPRGEFSDSVGIRGHFSPEDAAKLMHPHDSGFYKKGTGEFDPLRFSLLKNYAVRDHDGKRVISLEKYRECLQDLAKNDDRWKEAGAIDNLLGSVGNKGEIDFLFKVIPSRWVDGVPHAKLSDIKRFYTHTASVLKDIRNEKIHLPEKPPKSSTAAMINKALSATSTTKIDQQAGKPDLIDRVLASACRYANDVVSSSPSYFAKNSRGEIQAHHNTTFSNLGGCNASQMSVAASAPAPALGTSS